MRGVATAALASLVLGGCLAIYDYGDYVPEATSTGSTTGGTCDSNVGAPKACNDCLNGGQCTMELQACGADISTECESWATCIDQCCDPACFQACDDLYMNNAAVQAVNECMCDNCNTADTCGEVAQPCQ